MTSKPPRAAVWLVELFAPIESAEGVLGDLEEEFAGRLTRSGDRPARRWYWRQALRTTVHLVWGAVRASRGRPPRWCWPASLWACCSTA